MKHSAPLALILLLGACTSEAPLTATAARPAVAAEPQLDADAPATETDPAADPAANALGAAPVIEEVEVVSTTPPPPPQNARTVEEFDTTTPEERAAAAAPPPAPAPTSGEGRLGTTVASLGAADEPGFWIKTPLVKERQPGRLFYAASGRNVQVQLIPSGGSGGSQVSLAAMRLLDAPLDGLPEIVVYTN